MDTKFLIFLAIVVITIGCDGKAALRRKPKVYNALITTDEDLVQSRAYPVIQPTIHESGIAHYPYGPYNPYPGYYSPHLVRFGQPIAPALTPKEQLRYPLPTRPLPPQFMGQPLSPQPQPLPGYPLPHNPPTAPEAEQPAETPPVPPTGLAEQPQPTVQPPTMMMPSPPSELPTDPNQPSKMPTEQLPIPLNQYGLPPSLIPIRQQYQPHRLPLGPQNPVHLPPYSFNQFPPLYYNSMPGLRYPYLPSYDYLPTGPQFPLSNTIPIDKTYPQPPAQPQPSFQQPLLPQLPTATPPSPTLSEQPSEPTFALTDSTEPEPNFENIKNGSKSKDSNVPDVPPPPIPSGAKPEQS